jgi:hypothetical protein
LLSRSSGEHQVRDLDNPFMAEIKARRKRCCAESVMIKSGAKMLKSTAIEPGNGNRFAPDLGPETAKEGTLLSGALVASPLQIAILREPQVLYKYQSASLVDANFSLADSLVRDKF